MSFPKGSYTAKTDIADAFRLIPVHPDDYPKLGFQFQGQYYFDKCLPMGCASSCSIFEQFSTALQAIFSYQVPDAKVVHMLDDFLFIASDYNTCLKHINLFKNMCTNLGIPIAPDKTTDPSTNTTFLGIDLDSLSWTARLPQDKLTSYTSDLHDVLTCNKLRKKDLQSLIGKLSFAASVVPARSFLRRLIDLLSSASKPYFYIRINHSVKQDLQTWLQFLQNYNGVTFFRSLSISDSKAINMVSDASKQGFGTCYGSRWIQARYPTSWHHLHITVLELYPIFVLVSMFGQLLQNHNILFHCDNSAVNAIINSQTSKDKHVMSIIRPLVLMLMKFNISLKSKHIPGTSNVLSDRISRFQVTDELLRSHGMQLQQSTIPLHLLPENFTF
jgi:hypothetical protein